MHESYRGCGACMGPTGVVVGLWYVHGSYRGCGGSYRGCGTCMGPTGVVVHAWVLQGLDIPQPL